MLIRLRYGHRRIYSPKTPQELNPNPYTYEHICIYVVIYICVYTYIYIYIYKYIYICIYICICMCVCIYTFIYIMLERLKHVHRRIYSPKTNPNLYIQSLYTCTNIYIYIHIFILCKKSILRTDQPEQRKYRMKTERKQIHH
jgi:hypothetical protein